MKKKIVILFIILLFFINTFSICTTSLELRNTKDGDRVSNSKIDSTYYDIIVDDDETRDYTNIQDAIDNASNGDTIFVCNGTYIGIIIINKTISLIGESKENTIIDGDYIGDVVNIKADFVNISEFTIKNSGKTCFYSTNNIDSIIEIHSENNSVTNIIMKCDPGEPGLIGNPAGIRIDSYCNSNIIRYNNIIETNDAITSFSSGNEISNNFIEMMSYVGIRLKTPGPEYPYCSNNNICNNWIFNNTHKRWGYGIWGTYTDENNISGNKIFNLAYGIILEESFNNSISKNDIFDAKNIGISLGSSSKNNFTKNNISKNGIGIDLLLGSTNNKIWLNNIKNNGIGIRITNSRKTSIFKNNFIKNTRHVSFRVYSFSTNWENNYWDNQIIHGLPKIIFGRFGYLPIPWLNFDLRPARKPYII